jgi:hypothetical protein
LKFNKFLEKFEAIETELKLDESIIQEIPWWDMVRYPLFEDIFAQLSLKKRGNLISKSILPIRVILKLYALFKSFIFILSPRSPLWISKKTNIIWGHPRRKFENGFYTDIYSDPFIDLFPTGIDFTVIERNEQRIHLKPFKKKKVFFGEHLITLAYIYQTFKKVKFTEKELLLINNLENQIYKNFSCNIDIKRIIQNKLKSWFGIFPVMRLFFKLKKPKIFFIVVSAGSEAIIAAAKAEKIPTFELQHGSPTRGKLNYDYSSGLKKNTFPDWFLSFGKYWTSGFKLPLKDDRIIPIGYSYLNKKIAEYSHIKKENRLVVISQPKYSGELAELAIEISKKYKSLIVEFKPHPMEYNSQKIPGYFKKLEDSRVIISKPKNDLYEIFAKSRWQVGVYSTALYEGLCFGTACFLFDVPRAELMKQLIDDGHAHLVSTAKDVNLNWKIDQKKMMKYFSKSNKDQIDFLINLMNVKK